MSDTCRNKPATSLHTAAAVCVGLTLALSTVLGAPATAADGEPDFAAIDRYVQREMDQQRIPGLALGIVQGERIVHVRGFGNADPSGRAVTPQTPFFIGSITKSFTALAVMQLSEAGQVDLDAPVQRYLPWWHVADPAASAEVTVRDLLYQVSGFSKATGNQYATSGGTGEDALEERVRALGSAELTAPTGKTWQYSNANYWTLGLLVQEVSGQPYEEYVEQHIFGPLEMRHSFASEADAEKQGLVTGHRYWFGFPRAADLPFDRGGLGAGGLSSSVEDMTRYLVANVNDGRFQGAEIVSPAGMAELQREGVPTGQEGVSYAMGWDVAESNGIGTVSHDGSSFNAHANVVMVPDGRWGVVLLENAENSPDEFFGSRQMSGIAFGVTSMLKGKQALAGGSNVALWTVYGVILAIIALQVLGIRRTVLKFRSWRIDPQKRPRGRVRTGRTLGWPVVLSLVWAFVVLVALPQRIQAPLSALLMGLPDLMYLLVTSAVVALGWGIARTVWAASMLRSAGGARPTEPEHREPVRV
jgi:CubicO group peptidase (beta-lactamase class C family)